MTTTLPSGRQFPADFLWGSATASYQIEGAAHEDGRAPVDLGHVLPHAGQGARRRHGRRRRRPLPPRRGGRGDHGATSGLQAYRFSIAWPRVQPTGSGEFNQAGTRLLLDLVDRLVAAGIKPVATLYHWDLPQALEDEGGWTNRETAVPLRRVRAQDGRDAGRPIHLWTTLNEPWCSAYLGYASGVHAPGAPTTTPRSPRSTTSTSRTASPAAPIKDVLGADTPISVTLNLHVTRAATDSPEDVEAKRHDRHHRQRGLPAPDARGRVPARRSSPTPRTSPTGRSCRTATSTSSRCRSRCSASTTTRRAASGGARREVGDGGPARTGTARRRTARGSARRTSSSCRSPARTRRWAGTSSPRAWSTCCSRCTSATRTSRWRSPRTVPRSTTASRPTAGCTTSTASPTCTTTSTRSARPSTRGADVRGYFVWSLLDNFEWAYGYDQRFGVVRVDYDTLERTVKDSGHWYAELIATNAVPTPDGHLCNTRDVRAREVGSPPSADVRPREPPCERPRVGEDGAWDDDRPSGRTAAEHVALDLDRVTGGRTRESGRRRRVDRPAASAGPTASTAARAATSWSPPAPRTSSRGARTACSARPSTTAGTGTRPAGRPRPTRTDAPVSVLAACPTRRGSSPRDLDDTLLRDDGTVSRRAPQRRSARGGRRRDRGRLRDRPTTALARRELAEHVAGHGVAICSNGAAVLRRRHAPRSSPSTGCRPDQVAPVADASARPGRTRCLRRPSTRARLRPGDRRSGRAVRGPAGSRVADRIEDVLAASTLKLLVRSPSPAAGTTFADDLAAVVGDARARRGLGRVGPRRDLRPRRDQGGDAGALGRRPRDQRRRGLGARRRPERPVDADLGGHLVRGRQRAPERPRGDDPPLRVQRRRRLRPTVLDLRDRRAGRPGRRTATSTASRISTG